LRFFRSAQDLGRFPVPLQSEVILFAMLMAEDYQLWLLVTVASIGNTPDYGGAAEGSKLVVKGKARGTSADVPSRGRKTISG